MDVSEIEVALAHTNKQLDSSILLASEIRVGVAVTDKQLSDLKAALDSAKQANSTAMDKVFRIETVQLKTEPKLSWEEPKKVEQNHRPRYKQSETRRQPSHV